MYDNILENLKIKAKEKGYLCYEIKSNDDELIAKAIKLKANIAVYDGFFAIPVFCKLAYYRGEKENEPFLTISKNGHVESFQKAVIFLEANTVSSFIGKKISNKNCSLICRGFSEDLEKAVCSYTDEENNVFFRELSFNEIFSDKKNSSYVRFFKIVENLEIETFIRNNAIDYDLITEGASK